MVELCLVHHTLEAPGDEDAVLARGAEATGAEDQEVHVDEVGHGLSGKVWVRADL